MDFRDQMGEVICDPTQNKKSGLNVVLTKKIENPIRVLDDAALQSTPIISSNVPRDRLGVEIVFDINREPVFNSHLEISPLLRSPLIRGCSRSSRPS